MPGGKAKGTRADREEGWRRGVSYSLTTSGILWYQLDLSWVNFSAMWWNFKRLVGKKKLSDKFIWVQKKKKWNPRIDFRNIFHELCEGHLYAWISKTFCIKTDLLFNSNFHEPFEVPSCLLCFLNCAMCFVAGDFPFQMKRTTFFFKGIAVLPKSLFEIVQSVFQEWWCAK